MKNEKNFIDDNNFVYGGMKDDEKKFFRFSKVSKLPSKVSRGKKAFDSNFCPLIYKAFECHSSFLFASISM